jgi:hypothetical protein
VGRAGCPEGKDKDFNHQVDRELCDEAEAGSGVGG